MLIRAVTLAAALIWAAPALAQQTTEARAYADRVIAEADAGGIFENRTTGDVVEVVHIPSGMVCLFGTEPGNRVHIFPTSGMGIPRGDDVACVVREAAAGLDLTLYATRYPEPLTTQEIVSSAVPGILGRWPDARPYEGAVALMTVEGQEDPEAAGFVVQIGGHPMLTMVLGVQQGAWSYKVRVTGPLEDAEGVSLRAGLALATARLGQAR